MGGMDESGTPLKSMENLGNLPVNFHGNLVSATTDAELSNFLLQAKSAKRPVVINYGATWYDTREASSVQAFGFQSILLYSQFACPWLHVLCHACRQMLPTFCNASNEFPKSLFIYADIDKCEQGTQDVRYTPTFRFYQDGEKVDEFYGAGPQRLRDRLWLHARNDPVRE